MRADKSAGVTPSSVRWADRDELEMGKGGATARCRAHPQAPINERTDNIRLLSPVYNPFRETLPVREASPRLPQDGQYIDLWFTCHFALLLHSGRQLSARPTAKTLKICRETFRTS